MAMRQLDRADWLVAIGVGLVVMLIMLMGMWLSGGMLPCC